MLEPRGDDSVRFEFSRASTFARMADVRMTLFEVFAESRYCCTRNWNSSGKSYIAEIGNAVLNAIRYSNISFLRQDNAS